MMECFSPVSSAILAVFKTGSSRACTIPRVPQWKNRKLVALNSSALTDLPSVSAVFKLSVIINYQACDFLIFSLWMLVHRSDRQFYSEDDQSSPER